MNTDLQKFFEEFGKPGHGCSDGIVKKISIAEIGSTDELERFAAACLELKIYDIAETAAEKAVNLSPDCARLQFLCGIIAAALGKTASSITSYEKTLALDPAFVPALVNMAEILLKAGKITPATNLVRKALSKEPDNANANLLMGNALLAGAESQEAISYYKKAAVLSSGTSPVSNMLLSMHYDGTFSGREIADAHFKAGKIIEENIPLKICPKGIIPDASGRKIRVGYLSPDFRRHSVAYFIEPVIYCHDREKFDIFCYYDNPSSDEVTRRFKAFPVAWRDTAGLTDDALAELINSDSIDILVDLAGQTGKRLRTLSMRPAPLLASWMGYPSTTGLSSVDYFISDLTASPQGSESLYTEKLARISQCQLCFAPPGEAPETAEPPFLKNKFVTFGSMNNLCKVNQSVIGAWAGILRAVPDSKLLLKSKSLGDPEVSERFRNSFKEAGIAPERIIINGYEGNLTNHLEFYNRMDIALDTFPYNGVTTTCEALWMGVPVISLCGGPASARMGASLLSAVHLNGFISNSVDEYVSKAASLATSPDFLAGLRKSLRPLMASSALCDAPAFTAKLEKTYENFLKN